MLQQRLVNVILNNILLLSSFQLRAIIFAQAFYSEPSYFLLPIDPAERIDAAGLLAHPWLKSFSSQKSSAATSSAEHVVPQSSSDLIAAAAAAAAAVSISEQPVSASTPDTSDQVPYPFSYSLPFSSYVMMCVCVCVFC
jgi:hypothetical protein